MRTLFSIIDGRLLEFVQDLMWNICWDIVIFMLHSDFYFRSIYFFCCLLIWFQNIITYTGKGPNKFWFYNAANNACWLPLLLLIIPLFITRWFTGILTFTTDLALLRKHIQKRMHTKSNFTINLSRAHLYNSTYFNNDVNVWLYLFMSGHIYGFAAKQSVGYK